MAKCIPTSPPSSSCTAPDTSDSPTPASRPARPGMEARLVGGSDHLPRGLDHDGSFDQRLPLLSIEPDVKDGGVNRLLPGLRVERVGHDVVEHRLLATILEAVKTPFWSMIGPVFERLAHRETTVGVSRFLPICVTTSGCF